MNLYSIKCSTGCSCCHYEDHVRGMYQTEEDAELRIKYWLEHTDADFPVASQYARRGRYYIQEHEVEILPDGRLIIDEDRIAKPEQVLELTEEGALAGPPEDVTEYLGETY